MAHTPESIVALLWQDRALDAQRLIEEYCAAHHEEEAGKRARQKIQEWVAHLASPEAYRDFYTAHRGTFVPAQSIPTMDQRIPRLAQVRAAMAEHPPQTILDLGCFDGFALLHLCLAYKARGIGVDLDATALAHAQNSAQMLGLSCEFVNDFAESQDPSQPGLTELVDAILIMELLEHVPDPVALLRAAERRLAPGGWIYITTPATAVPHYENEHEAREHVRCLNEEELRAAIGDRVVGGHVILQPASHREQILWYRRPKITFMVNPVAGGWNPQDSKSYGGSEEAVVEFAETLAQQGHETEVYYNPPAEVSGEWVSPARVHYAPHNAFNPDEARDVCISMKCFLDVPVNTKRLLFWTADPCDPSMLTPERVARLHKIIALSEWHRREILSLNPGVSPEKIVAIPLGLPALYWETSVLLDRNPAHMVYASSFDRGLEFLLDKWGDIRRQVTQAELHVWYGWDLFDRLTAGNAEAVTWKTLMVGKMDQPGIVVHPRTTGGDLSPFLTAAVWVYPCTGGERFCLTAVKAQRLGAVPVVVPTMALQETVRYGRKTSPQNFVTQLVHALQSSPWQREERAKMIVDPSVALPWSTVLTKYWRPLWEDLWRSVAAPQMAKTKYRPSKQTVSACIITKNAEALLIRALRSIRPLAAEIIVADCSSTDRTREFAISLGARVLDSPSPLYCLTCEKELESAHFSSTDHEPWGFEGVRNISIKEATGDWIIWIDADEELLRAPNLEKYIRRNCFNGYAIRQHHFSASPPNAFKPDLPIRVFRNGKGIRFFGKVHEHPETALNESVVPAIVLSDVDIAHDGYLVEEGRRVKFQRNIGLMIADRRKYPERTLGKFLWIRDLLHLARYELERNKGQMTPEVVKYCEDAITLYEKEFLADTSLYARDGLDYYSEALAILGRGFEAVWSLGAAPGTGAAPGEARRGRFSSVEAWIRSLDAQAKSAVSPFTGRYA